MSSCKRQTQATRRRGAICLPGKHICSLPLILLALATTLFGCGNDPLSPDKVSLNFYIVSAQMIQGGQFIDNRDFPKLGWVPAVAALELRELEEVILDTAQPGLVVTDRANRAAVPPMSTGTTFHLRMTPNDSKRFAAVTESAVGKQLLLMLGNQPLIVVRVLTPIAGPNLQVYLDGKHDAARVGDALKKLVKHA